MLLTRPAALRALAVTALSMSLLGYASLQVRASTQQAPAQTQRSAVDLKNGKVRTAALADNCYYVEEKVVSRSGKTETRRSQECD
ncbi:hypothetical protein [Methylobacterium frigidaeris]|uniref:Uncharacterized protein n=1 Tax=Methylobacterium frigidaeris TaxID=2038277 RepID=A0AA37HHY5_9HYPH|nr:hypothetical protein [Methylobacterium frigidaeris]GJD65914.1 hypothetical protein MPEAHAMD_6110 [Methylobacterium frigidaeris]